MRPLWLAALLLPAAALAQAPPEAPVDGGAVTVMEYEPRSTLVVPETRVTRAAVPFVDAHAHLWRAATMTEGEIDTLVAEMDAMNMAVMVNLSGGSGEGLRAGIANLARHAPGRVIFFANVDFDGIDAAGWGERAAAQLADDVAAGAVGLKIYKSLGLSVTIPLFDRFQTRRQVALAEIEVDRRAVTLDRQRRAVATEVRQSVLDYRLAAQRLDATAAQVAAAEAALAAETARYELGAGTLVALEQARSRLTEARAARAQAVYQFVFQRAVIAFSEGALDLDDPLFD